MSAAADRARIDAVLNRSRRRLAAAEVWANVSVALAIALLAGEVLFAAGSRRFILPAVSLAVVAALIRASRRLPSVAETAAIVDRRLGLRERLIAAAQFRDEHDPLAQLVTRDAAAALHAFLPARAVSITTPRLAVGLGVAALALPLLLLIATGRREFPATFGPGGIMTQAGAPASPAPETAAPSHEQTAMAVAQSSSEPRPRDAEAIVAKTQGAAASTPPPTDARDQKAVPRRSNAGDAAAANRDVAAGSSSRAGGVAGGALGGRIVSSPANDVSDLGAANRAAWSRAQSAIAANRIPAERRELVRRYFEAVRPPEPR